MNTRDNPARTGTPEAQGFSHYCENCGLGIVGNYYNIDGLIFCEDCMDAFVKDTKDAPDFLPYLLMDMMDEYRVIA
ncbi:MAG: hypothetical protein J6X83_01410 [Methanomicrobium sp.]|nr:hypothetical protein [Methanomicrobium sp.]